MIGSVTEMCWEREKFTTLFSNLLSREGEHVDGFSSCNADFNLTKGLERIHIHAVIS